MSKKKNSLNEMKLYPIQAEYMNVIELHLKANRPPSNEIGIEPQDHNISMGEGKFDENENTIPIFVRLEAGDKKKDTTAPYYIKVEVVGIFKVSNDFPKEKLSDWAKTNSIFIFYPYLRETVFNLTARCGFRPLLLPLLEIPSFKVVLDNKDA